MRPPSSFRVLCVRTDGSEREFNAYRERGEAERVAAALARVGCASRVAGPDELDFPAPGEQLPQGR